MLLLCLPAHPNHRPERCLQAGGRQGHVQGQGACPCLWLRSLTCHRRPRAMPSTTATRCTASCSALARVRALFRCVTAARRPPLQGRQVSLSAGNAVKRFSRFLLDIHHAHARNGLAPAWLGSGSVCHQQKSSCPCAIAGPHAEPERGMGRGRAISGELLPRAKLAQSLAPICFPRAQWCCAP